MCMCMHCMSLSEKSTTRVVKVEVDVLLLFQNVPPDLSICTYVLEQSLSVRALQEMLASSEDKAEGVSVKTHTHTDMQQVGVTSGLRHLNDHTEEEVVCLRSSELSFMSGC